MQYLAHEGTDQGTSAYRVQSAFDAFRLLELLVRADQPMTATFAAQQLDEPRNRVYRLLQTLQEAGYVSQDPVTRSYRATLKLVSLGQSILRRYDLDAICTPILERVRDECGETAYLCARDGYEVVGLITVESPRMVRISSQPGKRWPLGKGANGQALVLGMCQRDRETFLGVRPDLVPVVERAQEHFEEHGVVYVDGEIDDIEDEHVRAIGVPIPYEVNGLELALAIAWPISRAAIDVETLRTSLLAAAHDIVAAFSGAVNA